jgi:GH25 family lysozyme M1 (1,4-beta-N-acetylmuramidase)
MGLLFDISKWQIFDNYVLLGERTVGGFIKATEATFSDPLFRTHWQETKEEGLLRGAYHFWRPDQLPEAQAQQFFETVRGSGDLGELPPVLDVEMHGSAAEVRTCAEEVERLFNRQPLIYTAQGIWNSLGDTSWASGYKLWVANYLIEGSVRWSTDLNDTVRQLSPFVPNTWEAAGWTFWQFTDRGHGPDFGLNWEKSKQIDLNIYKGTLEELSSWVGAPISVDPSIVTDDPWAAEPLPEIGKKVRVTVPGLFLRNAPVVLDGNDKDVMKEGDQTVITNVLKDENYIWCETGYRQWFAYKRRDGTKYVAMV